jgi:Uma2 family endonuclease
MIVQDRLYTADDLWDISHRAGETRRFEVVKGEPRDMTRTGGLHGVIALEIGYHVLHYVKKQHQLGYATSAETGFILATDPATVRAPDVGFVAKAHLSGPIPQKYFPLAPDLAVEVVSPSDTAQDIRERVRDFLKAGTRLVWVVYPESRTVDVYRSDGMQVVEIDGVLEGGDALPGFELALRAVFESVEE